MDRAQNNDALIITEAALAELGVDEAALDHVANLWDDALRAAPFYLMTRIRNLAN